ncbi:hypothetical protein DMP23_47030 [Amycolatopsis sp. A1MSW2902]|uniref:hypothetical protein n=1 Tax=Amycolatopsis sp. A1MSW2902 TaxID=687413 RepID=UPI00307D253A
MRVGSISRRDPFWLQQPRDDVLAAVADRAAQSLFDMTLPRDPAFLREHHDLLSRRFREATRDPAGWARVSWRVDGNAVPAAVYRFAGGWAACTSSADEVFLAANGIDVEPAGLEFERIDDERYGFNPRQPLPTAMPDARTRQTPTTRLRNPNMTTPHADHWALLTAS